MPEIPKGSAQFYEDFGQYFVCALWNGKGPGNQGDHGITYLTNRRAVLADYALCSDFPDQAAFFTEAGDAAAYLKNEERIRPRLGSEPWKVIRLAEMGRHFGFFDNTCRSLLGGREPEHPDRSAARSPMAP